MSRRLPWQFCLSMACVILTCPSLGQAIPPSDPQAIAVVQKAILAMGGTAAWQQVGGATEKAVITPVSTPAVTVTWSDDWSMGRVRYRRDSNPGTSTSASHVGSDSSQVHVLPNGKSVPMHHDNGIVLLAMGYPAPALILSLEPQYACTFQLGKPVDPRVMLGAVDPDAVAVSERCPDPLYPGGGATLTWEFSKASGTPKTVVLPIWGMIHQLLRTQTITFLSYKTVNAMLVPSHLQIRRVDGAWDQVNISKTIFMQSLPANLFQTAN